MTINVKLICNWGSSKDLCDQWNRMSKDGKYGWNDIKIVWCDDKFGHNNEIASKENNKENNKEKIDYWIIVNAPNYNCNLDLKRTLLYSMEPDFDWNPVFTQWRKNIKRSDFMYFLDHTYHRNNSEWHLNKTYAELSSEDYSKMKKNNNLSTVMSCAAISDFHKIRLFFLHYLNTKNDENHDIEIDIYGKENTIFNFKNWKGPLPPVNKNDGLIQYKYTYIM